MLTAAPAEDYQFEEWYENGQRLDHGSHILAFNAESSRILTAKFSYMHQQDLDDVTDALNSLAIGFAGTDHENSVTQDLLLPEEGKNGTAVEWASADETVVSADGKVTRPSHEEGDKTVSLIAKISKGQVVRYKTFELVVLKLGQQDSWQGQGGQNQGAQSPGGAPGAGLANLGGAGQANGNLLNGIEPSVLLNGARSDAGSLSVWDEGGRTFARFALDREALEAMFSGGEETLTIAVEFLGEADVISAVLSGRLLADLLERNALIHLITGNASFKIPVRELNMQNIAASFDPAAGPEEISVFIEIAAADADMTALAEHAAGANGFAMASDPISFSVYAAYGEETLEITRFHSFVERTVVIPENARPQGARTFVVINPDGTVRHVPTQIAEDANGKYAKIMSLSNSVYLLAEKNAAFADTAGHWADDAVRDMAARFIVYGTGNHLYQPDRAVTRAEFAALVTRALGIDASGGSSRSFVDVDPADWHAKYVQSALDYHLIRGFEDQSFRPNDYITREQAMVVLAKMLDLARPETKRHEQKDEILKGFADKNEISEWAKESVIRALELGIIQGKSKTGLAPKDHLTRAEAAVILHKFLQKANLI